MRKVSIGAGFLTLMAVAFVGGWISAISVSSSQKKTEVAQQTDTNQIIQEPVDIESGTGMTTSAMYDELMKTGDKDFDRRYIVYSLLMRSDLTAISRLAKERATNTELKTKANQLWEYDSPIVVYMYGLQHRLGYMHH